MRMPSRAFGAKLRETRIMAGMTTADLSLVADRTGVTKWECGIRMPSPTRYVILLAHFPKKAAAYLSAEYAQALAEAADVVREELIAIRSGSTQRRTGREGR